MNGIGKGGNRPRDEAGMGLGGGETHLCSLDRPLSLIGGHHTPVPGTGRKKQALVGVNRQDDSS